MQDNTKIAYLSKFTVERDPISVGGLSDKVYRANMNGQTYFIKYGNLAEVIAEKIFNDMASYCNLTSNEVIIIENDVIDGVIDSPYVVATKMVEGEKWHYSQSASLEILKSYAAFMAIKIFLIDDDTPEFILAKNNKLYSIDNSISGFSDIYLEFLNGERVVVKKIGKEGYEKCKDLAFKSLSQADVSTTSMSQILFTNYKKEFEACGVAKVFIDTLYNLSNIEDKTIEQMTTGLREIYSNYAIDLVNEQIKAFRKTIKDLIESDVK